MIGVLTGGFVFLVQALVAWSQRLSLGFIAEQTLARPEDTSLLRISGALFLGAALLALVTWLLTHFATKEPIDAVEANALHGGRMTWIDGVSIVVPILGSVGFGASVGIEAAVTQVGSVLASSIGRRFGWPRTDLRLLVGAGAAAAIAAAYHAPIAGMLYAYELILGSYSKKALAPIGLASVAAFLCVWLLTGQPKSFNIHVEATTQWMVYPLAAFIGIVSSMIGITVMLSVSTFELCFKKLIPPSMFRPIICCFLLAPLAAKFPAVLGSGHATIQDAAMGNIAGPQALHLLGAKGVASAISLGSGFRGGLFSASLMIGALLGQVIAWSLQFVSIVPSVSSGLCAAIAMAAVGASIIGSPLAMIFLVIEMSGNADTAVAVSVGALVSSFLTNRLFGYSFATWRFQQRGLALEGGHDISRLAATTIQELIRPPKNSVPADADLATVFQAVSTAGPRGTAIFGNDGGFIGLIDPRLVGIVDQGNVSIVASELTYSDIPLITPRTTLDTIIDIFKKDDRATLAVMNLSNKTELVGCIRARDAFALASSILDTQRRDELGV